MSQYKISQYNLIITENPQTEKTYVFNTYTCKGMWVPNILLNRMYLKAETNKAFCKAALNMGFIVPSDLDEVQRIRDEARKAQQSNRSNIMLTIAPTMACQYRCKYCYVHDVLENNSKMSVLTADNVIRFIIDNITDTVDKIVIKWLGGEPLLAVDIIEYITNKINEYIHDKGITLISSLVTNGRLLNKEMAYRLKNINIESVSVTLDGLAESYARLKGCAEQDFDAVINNIVTAQEILKMWCISINVTNSNIQDIPKLIKLLEDKNIHIPKVIVPIKTYSDYSDDSCIDKYKYDIMANKLSGRVLNADLIRRKSTCLDCINNHYSICSDGKIYKCHHHFNLDEYSIGDVNTPDIPLKQVTWNDESFYIEKKCESCKILPMCLGGCPSDKVLGQALVNCEVEYNRVINEVKRNINE